MYAIYVIKNLEEFRHLKLILKPTLVKKILNVNWKDVINILLKKGIWKYIIKDI